MTTAREIMTPDPAIQVRRLPVIDGHQVIGMVSQADVARALDDPQVGELREALCRD